MSQAIEPSLQENKNRLVIFSIKQNNIWEGLQNQDVSI